MNSDAPDSSSLESLARTAVSRFGGTDAWVNSAAVPLFGKFEEVPLELIRRVIEANLFGHVSGAQAVIPRFRKQGSGALIAAEAVPMQQVLRETGPVQQAPAFLP